MKIGPVDPRLLRHARAARGFFAAGAALALVQTASITAVAWFATRLITGIIDGSSLRSLAPDVALFAASVIVRAVGVWLLEVVASRGAAAVKSELRSAVVGAISRRGPAWLSDRNSTQVTTVATNGLDALDGYFARFLPQLILTAIATPILLLVLAAQDLLTAVIVVITLPVIPVFMILIGLATQAVQRGQWHALSALTTGFVEVVNGLSTLSIFGRQHRQAARIEAITDEYRSRTMSVLRVSFVSGFVLELAASLSVAVVAVSIGVRLVDGTLPLSVGLFVLLLTPEAYAPLRQVGAQFHASADGIAAANDVFDIIEGAPDTVEDRVAAAGADFPSSLAIEDLAVSYDGRPVVNGFSAVFEAGRLTTLAAPSGAGKSTIISAVLGFVPFAGSVRIGADATTPAALRNRIAWSGQRPSLTRGTVAANIALGPVRPEVLSEAMAIAAAELIDPALELGVNGAGLSGGQQQRVAIARAVYRALDAGCPVVILDEPTSALDLATEGEVVRGLKALATRGFAVVVVSHREAVIAASDTIVELRSKAVVS